jgi:hypothetical protein
MTETLVGVSPPSSKDPADPPSAEELAAAKELVRQARAQGVALTGPGGLLKALTKTVLETALEEEMAEHLGYDRHDPVGRNRGNSRNGKRAKTVLTDSGEVAVEVPRDRDGSFEPVIVAKRQRRYSTGPEPALVDGSTGVVDVASVESDEPQEHMGVIGLTLLALPNSSARLVNRSLMNCWIPSHSTRSWPLSRLE